MSELKPCPFCGKLPESQISIVGKDSAWCGNSSCRMNSGTRYTLEEWNTRPIEDALQAKLDIAVELLKEILVDNLSWFDDNWHIKSDKVALIQEELKKLEGE